MPGGRPPECVVNFFKRMGLFKSLVFVYVAFTGLIIVAHFLEKKPTPGTVIVLNGTSAVGKSSISRALQDKMRSKPLLGMGLDSLFVAVLPKRYISEATEETKPVMQGHAQKTPDGHDVFYLEVGPEGRTVISGMHHAIAAYAKQGNNVVVDYILYEREWLNELMAVLQHIPVYFIGIKADLDVIEQRERNRATSPKGHARAYYQKVHEGLLYDLELDTTNMSPEQTADRIKDFVESGVKPVSFEQMRKNRK